MGIVIGLLLALLAGPPLQLTFMTSAGATEVRAGQSVKLFVDITPKPKMHVYAPGAKDYQAIAFELNSAGVKAGKLTYPKSEDWYFEPTKEHVPVYQSPFRLTQDVTIDSTVKPGTFYVTGVLKYQACDETICYNPVAEPIAWTITVR